MSFPRYPAYKGSFEAWVGDVPIDWQIIPLKRSFRIEGGSTPSPDENHWDGDIVWLTPADLSGLESLSISASKRTITASGLASCGASLLPSGSLVLSTRAPIGSLAIAAVEVCTNQGCKGLVPVGDICSKYYAYVLGVAKVELNNRGKGTTFLEISGEELGRFAIPVPSISEQWQIARFLDHETARIDALIAEQQRLIELLKEKRQAVISHAVTKGLDPTVTMKDSGVEWLGEVPAHWDVLPVWMLFQMGRGRVISHDEIAENGGDYPVYSSQTERDGVMGCIDTYDFEGDYLTWTTDGANAGTVFRRSGRFNCTNVCGTLLPKSKKYDLRYFVDAVGISTAAFIRHDINPKLMNNVMASIKIPVPPLIEQLEIAGYVSAFKEKEAVLSKEAFSGISLLQERRSALISAAVTGKIDVRGWQPPADTGTASTRGVG
ncbi:restriction endonuclease subunit S [Stenotrophomonas ginsengisoli]|uniref:restriction endonuclease subunit S n=1 Tax=Stenotrophomonas ginsengisoli TaxID=336566 RepID=UPI0009F935CC|nr:restriction endonuclease subunit S [Stenotrophomonas ginsengisoli]